MGLYLNLKLREIALRGSLPTLLNYSYQDCVKSIPQAGVFGEYSDQSYSDALKPLPVQSAKLSPCIVTIGCCFDSHPRIDGVIPVK
jgi:hypothetical protein